MVDQGNFNVMFVVMCQWDIGYLEMVKITMKTEKNPKI